MQPFFLAFININMADIFKNILIAILENDLGLTKPKHRQQSDRQGPTLTAKSQSIVPDYLKVPTDSHPKIEILRNKKSGKILLNDLEVRNISELYNIKNLSPDEPRECGTTGIVIQFDNMTGRYKLVKGDTL